MQLKLPVAILAWLLLLVGSAMPNAAQIPVSQQPANLNITLGEQRVRFAPTRSFQEMRLEVVNSIGEIVFTHLTAEAEFDWNLRQGNGEPLTPGLYRYVLSLKFSEDQSRQHTGHFIVEKGQDQIWLTAHEGATVSGTDLNAARSGGRSIAGVRRGEDGAANRAVTDRTLANESPKQKGGEVKETAKAAPLTVIPDELTVNGNITLTPGVADIKMTGNTGGLRFYGAPTLDFIPQAAAIQFWGNASGLPGQLYLDSGAHNNAALIFRTTTTGQQILERMRVTATGNVGIGTTAPGYKLDVLHGGSTGIRVRSSASWSVVDIDAASGDAALRFQRAGVNQWLVRNNPGNDDFQIYEQGAGLERMRIEYGTGRVVIGGDLTASGNAKLHVADEGGNILFGNGGGCAAGSASIGFAASLTCDNYSLRGTGTDTILNRPTGGKLVFRENHSSNQMTIDAGGNVGIGTGAPTHLLSVNGDASKPGGGMWAMFSDERLKNIHGKYSPGLQALLKLQPIRFEYKTDNALGLKATGETVGFSAQAVQQVLPEAVSQTESGYLQLNSDPILWTMLNSIKEQQAVIERLQTRLKSVERALTRKTRKR